MLSEGIPLTYEQREVYGTIEIGNSRLFNYFIWILEFTGQDGTQGDETEKDIWELDRLDIPFNANPIQNNKTINFTGIPQPGIRKELKKGIYLNLQKEALAQDRNQSSGPA